MQNNYRYKDSGIEWLGEVPEHWGIQKLKHVATYSVSNVDKKTQEGESPILLFNYTDVYNNEYLTNDMELMAASASQGQIDNFIVHIDDVLITKDSEDWRDIAKPALVKSSAPDIVCGYHLALIRPSNLKTDGKFLFRLLQSTLINQQFQINSNGVTRYGLPKSAIGESLIILPPYVEQQSIIQYLDRETSRIDALIQKKERLIELLKEKRIALITQAVTKGLDPTVPMKDSGIEWLGEVPEHWEVKRIKHVATRIQTGCTPPTSKEQYYEDGTIQWFGPSSFTEDLYLSDPVKIINESSVTDGVARLFEEGSVMMVGIGATIGKIAQIKIPSSCNQQITVVTLKRSECDPDYYTYLLKTMETTIRGIAPSATLAIFDQGKIGSLSVLKPPLFEQVQVAEFLSDKLSVLEHMMSTISGSIRLLREYRSSLIHHAVTGKIDLRGYDAKAQ